MTAGDLITHPVPASLAGGLAVWALMQLWRRMEKQQEETLPSAIRDINSSLQQIFREIAEVNKKLAVIVNDYEHLEDRVDSLYKSFRDHMDRWHGGKP